MSIYLIIKTLVLQNLINAIHLLLWRFIYVEYKLKNVFQLFKYERYNIKYIHDEWFHKLSDTNNRSTTISTPIVSSRI